MIDFDKVQFILFDFDDTLCIHSDHRDTPEGELEYNIRVLRDGVGAWGKCKKNEHMQRFIDFCKFSGKRMGLISATVSHVHNTAKAEWVKQQYEVALENYCVGTFKNKINIMIAISEAYEIPRECILIVDDLYETLTRAANEGFMACTPMEVVNFVEEANI